jgi:hypothetical protein
MADGAVTRSECDFFGDSRRRTFFQSVEDFLQPLKPMCVIPRCAE